MKRMAFVIGVVAMAGCSKGEQKPAAAAVGDTTPKMMSDTSPMMMSDTSPKMMSDTSHMMMSDSSKMKRAAPKAQMSADSTSAKRGATLFNIRGCDACHNISHTGKMSSGPSLGGVTQRRTHDWLTRWLKDPAAMLASDSIAIAMLIKWKNVKMPNVKLSDAEVEALINYLATQH
jgi:protein SCO1/2